jgi:hypothetical protein
VANTIALAKNYIDMLDEVYKLASTAADLTSSGDIVRAGANAEEILVPKMSMSGLRNYDRGTGYKTGNVQLEWETKKFNYDRGLLFQVDTMDNEESINLAFGQLGAEFMRNMVAPEADAFTYAKLAGTSGITDLASSGVTYSSGEEVLDALVAAMTAMDEAEVPATERYLKITPTLYRLAQNVKTYISSGILDSFAGIVAVPQSRFYTQIDLLDTDAGNYQKTASTGADINFMIIYKPAIIKYDKHVASDVISPAANQTFDAYMMKYRKYGIAEVYDNKAKGIVLSHKAAG